MPPKLFIMLAHHNWPQPNPVMVNMLLGLQQRGFQLDIGIAAHSQLSIPLKPQHDLYILKSRSPFWLHVAALLDQQGATIVDSYASRLLLRNKALTMQRLQTANLPTPRTWLVGHPAQLTALAAAHPLILKPVYGEKGASIHIVPNPGELTSLPDFAEPMMVQEYLPHEPEDVKVYVIGEHLFAFRKAFNAQSYRQAGQPFSLPAELHHLALACGQACEVTLYGVDMILTSQGAVVVDVNWFPSYRTVPKASDLLVEHITQQIKKRA